MASVPSRKFRALFHRHAAAAFDGQLVLRERIGGREPSLDVRAGRIRFLPDLSYRVQVVGKADEEGLTWAWDVQGLPASLRRDADALRRHGERYDVPELEDPRVDRRVAPRFLAMVACGMARAYAFCHDEETGLYVLIQDPRFGRSTPDPIARIAAVFPRFAAKVRCDHRAAFVGYLQHFELDGVRRGDDVATRSGDRRLVGRFDPRGRLRHLESIREDGGGASG